MSQKRSAFLFGANGPEAVNLKPLRYAQNDIKHLKTAFSSSFCNFHQVVDQVADTASILLTQLERFAYTCKRPDLLVIHFSGHGFVWNGQLYLICNTTDVDAKLFSSTAINITQIKTILDQCSAKHKLLILDCCFAGIAQGIGTWKGEEQLPGLESLKGSVNAILAACPAHRKTRELDALELYQEKGAGFLSWAIARACDKQFTQAARDDTLSLSDIEAWLSGERDNINKYLSSEDRIPAPRILNERDLVGDDEIWFTSRRRSSSNDESLVEKRQREEHALFQHVSFLQQPCPTARPEDFDADRVQKYAQYDEDVAFFSLENLPRLCQQLGLTSTIGTPIIAAVLAFHKAPSRHIHSALIRTTCYAADERDRYLMKDIEGPLGKQVEHTLRWLLDSLRTISEHVDAEKRVDRCEIPELALRELVTNAVVHRDYEANESIQIKITPRQVTITNPGRLNVAIMNHEPPFAYRESHPHNPLLLKILIAESWAEGRSRGFKVVMEEFRRYGLVLPEIKNLPGNLVQITIQRPEFDMLQGPYPMGLQHKAGHDINNIFPNAPWTPPVMLPPRAQSFVGREEDLAWLLQQLRSEVGITLALCGPGGMGKTALAAEALSRLVAQEDWMVHFPDGIFYHSFYAHPSLAVAFEELARVFGEDLGGDPHLAARRAVSGRRALLVFDGVEGLDDARPLRELGSKNVILVLSRRRSDAPDLAHRRDLGVLSPEHAMTLLQELASPHAADHQCVEQLVQYIGGYPLALQLIGSYLSSYQEEVQDYLTWFESEGLASIHFGEHQYQSVSVLLQRTYHSLAQSSQDVFLLLGLLASAPFPLELVQEILELPERDARQAIGPLVNLSVLRRPDQSSAYEVSHPLVHTFATEHLVSQGHAASFPSTDRISTWRERFLATLATHFDQSDPYDTIALALWQPHVLPLLSAEYLTAEQSLTVARLFNRVGFAAHTQGKYTEAEPLYVRALAIREQQLSASHPDTAASLNNLAELYRTQGKYTEAEPLYVRALAIREQQLGAEHPDTAQSLNNLAYLYHTQGKDAEAEPLYQRALAIDEQQLGAIHPDTALSLNNLALLYHTQGKYAEAEPLYVQALAIREQQLGASHPDTAQSLNNLAYLYHTQGKYTEAEPLYVRALAIREQQLGAEHPDTAQSLNNLAALYKTQGKYAEAEPLYVRALAIYEQHLGASHPDTASSFNNLAVLYTTQGKYTEAEPLYVRALAIYEQQLGATHPDTALSLNNLAALYDTQGKDAEAEPLYQRALAIFENTLGQNHPSTQTVRANYTFLLQEMEYDGAS